MTLVSKMRMQFWLVVAISSFISAFMIAPITYMLADNQQPYVYDAANSYVLPSQTVAGRQMLVHWKLKRVNRICTGMITRVIVDEDTGVKTVYDPTPAARMIDPDALTLDRTFYLPPLITPGRKSYYADAEFTCNLLQHFYPLRVVTPRLGFVVEP